MKRFIALLVLFVIPLVVLAQSVPGPAINPNCNTQTGQGCTIWTPSQWISAWQAKMDATAGAIAAALGYIPANRAGDTLSGSFAGNPNFTGAPTFGVGSGGSGVGLTVNNGLVPARLSQTTTNVWSGASSPNSSISPIYTSQSWSGFQTDGAPLNLNYFRTTDNTKGAGTDAFEFWEDVQGGAAGHVAVLATAGNDAFSSYSIPAWVTGTAYTTGQVVAVSYNVIRATSTGTSGAVTPTCTVSSPTCSDGTVTWNIVQTVAHSQSLIGLIAKASPTVSWGGAAGAPIGDTFGLNSLATCQGGYQASCIGYENDFGIPAGNNADDRVGEQIVIEKDASVAGNFGDLGWSLVSQGGTAAPLANLMIWSSPSSGNVVSSTGYGLQASSYGGGTTTPAFLAGAGAIDMEEWAPSSSGPFGSGFILRGPGSQILGNGDVQSNYALLHKTTTGESLDVPEYQVTAVAVTGGSSGTGWTCTGKWAHGSDGTIVQITSINSGAVTGVSLILGAFSSTNTSPATFTAEEPKNCGATSATGSPTAPSTFSVNETWSQANSGSPVLTLGGTASTVFAKGVSAALPGGPKASRFYPPIATNVPVNTAVGTANRLWVAPVYIATPSTMKSLSFDIGTGNASAWNGRMCVFADTGAGLPGANVVDSGTVAVSSGSVTGIQTASLNSGAGIALNAGTYWVGMMADSTSESVFAFNNGGSYWTASSELGFGSLSNLFTNAPTFGYYMTQTLSSGCPPNFSGTPTDAAGQSVPYIAMGY